MTTTLLRPALRRALAQIRRVAPPRPAGAGKEVAGVFAEAEREFGMLPPPIALHAAAPEVLAASWVMLRETLVAGGRVDRATKEAVAAAVSAANSCPYCVQVHGATLAALLPGAAGSAPGRPGARAGAGAEAEATAAGVADWLRGAGGARFPAQAAPELVGVAVTFHYLNRMVNLFLAESPVPPGLPPAARSAALAVLGRLMRRAARGAPPAGTSLDLLPSAPLPGDLRWAAGTPSVAGAFARAAAAVDAAGARAVPEGVRALVTAELAGWSGEAPGLGRAWVEEAVSALPEEQRAAGRLALLTAKASYQVDDRLVAEFRHGRPGDTALIELTSWAALTAARELGSRLAERVTTAGHS
ncbi:AhpD family alkylhydroperoxidase [Streptomyces sp. 1114.5]|uniref:carboxymuconolactone decarboxylase family protein n=1 Tax=unclassified Streptomyces TaxID=2593676 RepID=UPI000BDB0FCD|nr:MULTISPECIES: carboxymuconolactone decarboxylase family protein [unclassified Streptomyces]RKT19442.1 AhpD family alkylhydroperoxidase [Streptomyces sp. 1114.5]SOB85638.1 alkylhydroperoxidase AhpD family core domain-containing protein [Streptomyces sp. 1331.2]